MEDVSCLPTIRPEHYHEETSDAKTENSAETVYWKEKYANLKKNMLALEREMRGLNSSNKGLSVYQVDHLLEQLGDIYRETDSWYADDRMENFGVNSGFGMRKSAETTFNAQTFHHFTVPQFDHPRKNLTLKEIRNRLREDRWKYTVRKGIVLTVRHHSDVELFSLDSVRKSEMDLRLLLKGIESDFIVEHEVSPISNELWKQRIARSLIPPRREITDESKISSPTTDKHIMLDPCSIAFTTSSTSDSKSLLLSETRELQYTLQARREESLTSDIAPSSPTSVTMEMIEQCRIQGSFHDAISQMSSEEILRTSEYSDSTNMEKLLDKALEYSNKNNTETALKYIWLTVSLSVKKLFLEACRCDIRSNDAISLLGRLAISSAGLLFSEEYRYMDSIDFAEDARQVYDGHIPFGKKEIANGISSIRNLLRLLDEVNENKKTINVNFEEYCVSMIREEHGNVLWTGKNYEYTTVADINIV